MSSITTVDVVLAERGYTIEIGTGNLAGAGRFVSERAATSHVALITDDNVVDRLARPVAESLSQLADVDILSIEPGETAKSIETADVLWQKLLDIGADRKTLVVAVGGGVVGDLAGFIAATFARGLPFVQIPTTLLAQVDSSVGGKVGINLPGAKNMVGAFWQPRGVLIDTAVLSTLPEREYRAGLAEVVKYGVILDEEFFAYLEGHVTEIRARQDEVLRHIVARSCQLKANVVSADEREETGLRAVLNYGHTFCHAFETLTGYGQLLHGEAVAIGMTCAARLAERLGRIDGEFSRRQQALLLALGLPTEAPRLEPGEVIAVMARDKKAAGGRLRFVLPTRLGHVELVGDVPETDVRAALASA
ncbi:MAG TPA: 3-dehydroquinate synthase [Pirellulales bacterium]|nr:3-dehydroquinate synthase [Pirellulales bacterium]